VYLLLACNFLRDLVVLIIIIIANITIGILLKKYAPISENSNTEITLRNNGLFAFILCSLSTLVHLLMFSVIIIAMQEIPESRPMATLFGTIGTLLDEIKYAINIFLLYKLNKKFREGLKNYLSS